MTSTTTAGTTTDTTAAIGAALVRVEGPDKVRGAAPYAYEYPVAGVTYCCAVGSTVARGRVRSTSADVVRQIPGVLEVLWHANAPRLAIADTSELAVLQSDRVAYRRQIVAAVVAESFEIATEAARTLEIEYDDEPFTVELRADDPDLYRPDKVNPNFPTDTEAGDVDTALRSAIHVVDHTYRTPAYHNNPMEPHASIAVWHGDELTVFDSNQGASPVRARLAELFGVPTGSVRVVAEHVGGGFGAKGTPRPVVVLAAMAARVVDRPVKIAATREQMFAFVGYRTPTIQRVQLGADADGRIVAISHDVVEQTSTIDEFAEQTAVATRIMYAGPNRRTTHRLRALDVPTPAWMRAPGECPGMFALESAVDELAIAAGLDPIELRLRNDPQTDPETGAPFTSRNLEACLRDGARLFGWTQRNAEPRAQRDGRWLVGTGVAASTYPARARASKATARARGDGSFDVELCAADIGTGARTALTQIAADALGVEAQRVRLRLGDTDFSEAPLAGGSMGTSSWGWAVTRACEGLRGRLAEADGSVPVDGLAIEVDTKDEIERREQRPAHAFGAQFAEVRVDEETGEIRVARLLGVFAVGRIVNPMTARSQLIGGMTMGISMALLEASLLDREYGDYLNHDLAQYEIATCADVPMVEAHWIDERDDFVNPMGAKGVGEIGIVGTAAAIANATYNATGVRVRDLPIRLEKLLG
ncbi:MAG: xanthine dehydrogenase YagR molybdenum-binding subunit [Actinomycetota bacterium]|nr:xanthine dehydrogenase YagR molybdenum-binding subunit [Actinomycetota bacterium]